MAHPALMESRRPAPRIPSSRRRLRQATPRSRWKTATAKCITSSLRRPTAHFRSGAAARRRSHGPGLRCRGFPVPGAQPPACAAVGVLRLRSALDRRSQARAGSRDPRPNALFTVQLLPYGRQELRHHAEWQFTVCEPWGSRLQTIPHDSERPVTAVLGS